MSSRCRIVAFALCAAALARAGSAGEPAADPVLAALLAEALERNPELVALGESLRAARERPAQARALADPMLSVLYTNDGWSPSLGERDMTTLAFMGSMPLPRRGVRGLRGAVAEREADLAEQQLERARLAVAAEVKRAYYGLALSQERLELVREQEQIWRQIEGVARARYAVGQGAQPDVLRVQIEVTRADQLVAEQLAEARIRGAELVRLTGRPAGSRVETPARLALRPFDDGVEQTLERLAAASPELRGAAVAQDSARLRVELAGKEYGPEWSVQAGYMNRGGLDPMWQAGVTVGLPLARQRRKSGLAEAEAQARAAAGLAESARQKLRYRTEERLARLAATAKIAGLYEHGIIPQDRMSVDAALANYQSGKVPFVAVLEALTTLYEDRSTHLGLLADHERTRASLEEASLDESGGTR
jgi:outer membrane protein TolC